MTECPLCARKIKKPKFVYGHAICKKCWAGYINRRQVAFTLDAVLLLIAAFCLEEALNGRIPSAWIGLLGGLLSVQFWLFRDSIGGRSPGKICMNVAVIDNATGEPANLSRAMIRNLPLAILAMLGVVAQLLELGGLREMASGVGGLTTLTAVIVLLCIAFQISKGPRWGDGRANTRVIWNRHANSYVFNPTFAATEKNAPEFAPAMHGAVAESANDPYRAPRS